MQNTQIRLQTMMVGLFFLLGLLGTGYLWATPATKNVLIIHSYHQGYGWTDALNLGIERELNSLEKVELHMEYMDTKRYKLDEISGSFLDLIRQKYMATPPDVIIISDNNALLLAKQIRKGIFPCVPIVFCGINNYEDCLAQVPDNSTGVAENADIEATIRLILGLQKNVNRIAFITDNTTTGKINAKLVDGIIAKMSGINFLHLKNITEAELRKSLSVLPQDTALIEMTFFIDRLGKQFTQSEYLNLIKESCDLPIYSCWDMSLGLGSMGGAITSGALQGKNAALMTKKIMSGTKASDIDVIKHSPTQIMLDWREMQKHKIDNAYIPSEAIVLYKPATVYHRYRKWLLVLIIFFFLQTVIIVTLVRNIWRRRRAEKNRDLAQNDLRKTIEHSPMATVVTTIKGKISYYNHQFVNLFDYEPQIHDTLNELWMTAFPDSVYRKKVLGSLLRELKRSTEENIEFVPQVWEMNKDNNINYLEFRITQVGEKIIVVIGDITRRTIAERAILKSEKKYRSMFENASIGFFRTNFEDGTILEMNDAAKNLFAYEATNGKKAGKSQARYMDSDDRKLLLGKLLKDKYVNQLPLKMKTYHGELIWIEVTAWLSDDGKVIEGVFVDCTKRKTGEYELANERERLSVTLRSIGDAVIATDTTGIITEFNRAAEEMTGWERDAAVGQNLMDVFCIISKKTEELIESPVQRVLQEKKLIMLNDDLILVHKDGNRTEISDTAAPILNWESEIIGTVIVIRDITGRTRLEEEIQRGNKLESIGVLAGGIAHDFNNILTAILGNLSLAIMDCPIEDPSRELLVDAEKASMRAQGLTKQLLTFAKGGAPIKEFASIKEIISDSSSFVLRGSKAKCKYTFMDDLKNVEVDKGQISQVIQNLIINANQAMPDGGLIDVKVENYTVSKTELINLNPGEYVKIAIRDTGIGIPEKFLKKIFDPYYSTKHEGSGLGLSIVFSIVQRHEGLITVKSENGVGSIFNIFLPAVNYCETNKPASDMLIKGKGRVLVMDDEVMIQKIVGGFLRKLGYRVGYANNGAEAIELYKAARESGDSYDMVIMDLTIPGGQSGEEVVIELKKVDPLAKVIVSSGYSNSPIMANYKEYGFDGVIGKPYLIKELSKVLEEALWSHSLYSKEI